MAGVVSDALATVLRLPSPPRLVVAGRTDAGVHARGQVAHLDVPGDIWRGIDPASAGTAERATLRRVTGVLPGDIRISRLRRVPSAFDARFSASSRRYAYRVWDGETAPDPLRRQEVLWHRRPLDIDRMSAAADGLLGEHDFLAYCRPRAGATTTRELLQLDWTREPDGTAVATVVGSAFCHNQVRAMVGALLMVGDGRRTADWPAAVLRGQRRGLVTVAAPHGLTLEEVRYGSG